MVPCASKPDGVIVSLNLTFFAKTPPGLVWEICTVELQSLVSGAPISCEICRALSDGCRMHGVTLQYSSFRAKIADRIFYFGIAG